MISIDGVSKSFGGQTLFDNISFKVNSRERVGLVGRNGHGKTTLVRILTGQEEADTGQVMIPKNYTMGYVRQHIQFTRSTVLQEAALGLREEEKEQLWKVERILSGLGFSSEDMERSPLDFSGGYQVRLNLARVLVSEPDLLLLDEPTNYLDITSIRWIQGFLRAWPGELILITHDRGFMDSVVTHVVGIHRQKARKIPGNTEKFYEQIAQEEEIYEKTRVNDEKRRKEIELFVTRFRAKARLANMVQSRLKTLSKMEKKDKLEAMKNLDFSFRSLPFKGKQLVQSKGVSFGYDGGPELIKDLDFTVHQGDRICVIGKNGKGKTTLLKIIAGALAQRQGEVAFNPGVVTGFYEQTNVKSLVDERTIEEEVMYASPDMERQGARNICGAMMFEGDLALKTIGVLSGGEKARVMLGKLLATPVNLLLLDEPTNHLDMEACDSLLTAIDCFDGAVMMVTHNEMFLHALANRLIVYKNDRVEVFDGSYAEFLEKVGWDDDETAAGSENNQAENDKGQGVKLGKKELRKLRSEIISRRSKAVKPLEKKIAQVEAAIEKDEAAVEEMNQEMLEVSLSGDGKKIADLSKRIHEAGSRVDENYGLLEELTDEYDRIDATFKRELEELESEGC